MEPILQRDVVRPLRSNLPRRPADEPVDCVTCLGLIERKLVMATVEVVGAVLEAIRPRCEDLPSTRRADLIYVIAVDDVTAVDGVRTKSRADLGHDGVMRPEPDLVLFA